jgi:protein ImuB
MTLAEARALCTGLEALPWDDVAVSAAITETTARFVRVSPQVSPVTGAPGMWWIGASGFAAGARAAGEASEVALGHALYAVARHWHPHACVAIADSCVAARAATWASASFGGGRSIDRRAPVRLIPHGGDAAYLASAPLTLLPMDPEIRDALSALGLRTIGDFARLDAGDVEQRWGNDGLTAWRLARGDDPRRPVLAHFDAQCHVEMELATPAATMEPVLFLVRPGVEHLVAQLVSQGRAIASLAVTLTLDDARGALPDARPHTVTREIRLPRPLARPAPLFERCRGLLARWPLTAPVTAVRLTVLLTSPLSGEQGHLLNTSWRDPGAADAALERVRAELGPETVVIPQATDGYTPERSGRWHEESTVSAAAAPPYSAAAQRVSARRAYGAVRETDSRASPARSAAENETGRRPAENDLSPAENGVVTPAENALRLLEAPEKVDVDRDGEPRRIFWRGRAILVTQALGPERLSGDWWNDGFSRDYWRCESDADIGELVVYRDVEGWWVQGWYD